MTSPLTVFLPLTAASATPVRAALSGDPPAWLANATAGDHQAWSGVVPLDTIATEIACRVGNLRTQAASVWRDLSWSPTLVQSEDQQATTAFDGEIGLHSAGMVLALTGTCRADDGTTDADVLQRLGNRLGRALLARIVRHAGTSPGSAT